MAQGLSYLVYCRPGFEKDAVAELSEQVAELGLAGYGQAKANSGYARFVLADAQAAEAGFTTLCQQLPWQRLIFARQLLLVLADLIQLAKDLIKRRGGAVARLNLVRLRAAWTILTKTRWGIKPTR